jgi:hypothetical protein
MKKIQLIVVALLAASTTLGCQFNARSAEDYATETKALLKSKKGEIKSCYDEVLKSDKKAAGVVAVNFTVQKKTGEITDVQVDNDATTAPAPLADCVVNAMAGLALDPPDARTGKASFTYDFAPKS